MLTPLTVEARAANCCCRVVWYVVLSEAAAVAFAVCCKILNGVYRVRQRLRDRRIRIGRGSVQQAGSRDDGGIDRDGRRIVLRRRRRGIDAAEEMEGQVGGRRREGLAADGGGDGDVERAAGGIGEDDAVAVGAGGDRPGADRGVDGVDDVGDGGVR